MLDRVTSMQVFARVAALGSLSAAARALGMSQTMATKHMGELEGRLGTKLVHRTTRRLTLTEAGRNYLEAVERILADIEEANARILREAVEISGTLRLNAPVSFGIRQIAPLIPELRRRHPELSIDLGLNDRHINLIEEGWDLVVRIGSMQDSSLVARRLAPCPLMVCAAPSYLARNGKPRKVEDLKAHTCLGYTLSRTTKPTLWQFGKDGKIRVNVHCPVQANNGDALVAAAVGGEGIIYQPAFLVAPEIEAGMLVPLKLDHPAVELDGIFAAYPSDRRPPAKVRATIDFLAEHLVPGRRRRARA